MNIFQTIKDETVHCRDKNAVVEGANSIAYGELIASAEMIAASLKEKGVLPFQRVALLCNDSIDYILTGLAVLSASAVIVPIAVEHTTVEIDNILERIEAEFLVFEKGLYGHDNADKLKSEGLYKKELYIQRRKLKQEPDNEYYRVNPAFIRFSSGTTGTSKGVVLSHESIIERTDGADGGLHITAEDTVLWVLSMSFHFIVTILLFLRRGAAIVLCGSPFPEALAEGAARHSGTVMYASPFHYNLLARTDLLTSESLAHIRLAVSTAMTLPPDIADAFYSKFHIELSEAYGIIEVGLPFINLSRDKGKRSSVGRVLPDYEMALFNQANDGVGQIHIKGRGMLDAYFSPWQNRDSILEDGWFNTGDLGRVDKDGYLYIVGRDKNVINFAGMKVFPFEVESVLNEFPAVKESYVYGEDHRQYGQLPAAKVVLNNEFDGDSVTNDLRRFCYERLAQYKVPKSFEVVEELIKTPSGKIMR